MAIVKMKKVFIMSYKNWLNSITETLQQLGIMQITNIFKGSDIHSMDSHLIPHSSNNDEIDLSVFVDEKILELQYLLNFLPAQLSEKKSFIEDMMGNKNIVKQDILDREINLFDFKALFEECKKIETELSKLVNEKNSISKTLEILSPWKNLSERLENIRNTQTSFLLFLRLSLPQFKIIQEAMEKELEGCFLL
ncbi:hypothetical protein HY745_02420, partial [Candidatus Desantisbacteria bacterium]|nr:hypothetical protein [Candidatus Desantisbacteria bacterium]